MKKILIASACAITLCFTSCASKQAPDTTPQTETAPQLEDETDVNNQTESDEESDTETETDTENNSESENTEDTQNETAEEVDLSELSSEDFPEPEFIDEPEIITLEPQEEVTEEETPEEAEPVETEEPQEITVIVENDEENPSEEETSENEDNPEDEDISANDVVIVTNPDSDGISGGIDITDDDFDSNEEVTEPKKEIIPSRSVTLKKFEYLDVTYPGTGWIYMGITDDSKDIAYFGRKLGTKDTKFTLQARSAGTKIIHFYKNDPLTGQYLDDYIEVIIQAENGSNKNHIEAPAYTLPVQKKEKTVEITTEADETEETEQTSEKPSEEKKTETTVAAAKQAETVKSAESASSSVQTSTKEVTSEKTETVTETKETATTATDTTASNPDTLLQEAQLLYNEKEYKAALNKLNQFFEYSTDNRDEALYLKGQILEAKSDVRDIKGAMEAYTTLTKNYPASKLWDSANKRIIYLKRFYLEVR